ncbi:MAG: metalloprotease [Actinomycetota bacterium]|nr:hypothetical protein [Actinomycetota bacterium]
MRRGPHFKLFGIPVHISGSFALVALMGLSGGLEIALIWVAIVFVTTLVHELGHALAYRAYGRASTITMWGLGGVTHGAGPPLTRARTVIVSLAGSITEIILVGLPALYFAKTLEPASPHGTLALDLLVYVGIGWAILNLLPVLPLDGGRVVATVLEGAYGIKGARAARWLGMVIAAGAAVYGVTKGFIFAAFFGLLFIAQNRNDLHRLRDAPATDRLAEGHELIDRGDIPGALRLAGDVAVEAKNPLIVAAALHLSAWAHLAGARREEAAASLAQLPQNIRPSRSIVAYTLALDGHPDDAVATAADSMLEGDAGIPPNAQLAVLFEREGRLDDLTGRLLEAQGGEGPKALLVLSSYLHRAAAYEVSVRVDEKLYADGRIDRGISAYNAACGLARLGRTDDALSWLERAEDTGFADAATLDADEDLASLRHHERFSNVRSRLSR